MVKFKIKLVIGLIVVTILTFIITTKLSKLSQLPVVGIVNWGPHATLQAVIDGVKAELTNQAQFKILDVNFDQTLIIQALHQLQATKPAVIITMGTPITQAAKKLIKDIPVVFAAVTEPNEVGLGSEAGISDRQDLKIFLAFAKKLIPSLNRIGLLYATSEANDLALVKMMKQAADLHGMNVVAVPVEHARDIPLRMRLLNGKVDLLYVGVSGTIQPSLPAIVAEADRMKIPVFNVSEEAVFKHHVVGSFGLNYYKLGQRLAGIVKNILLNKQFNKPKLVYPKVSDFYGVVSKRKAQYFNIIIPDDLENVKIIE
jgi:putative tryptophan/tyrosine transport system substrate-binding protein